MPATKHIVDFNPTVFVDTALGQVGSVHPPTLHEYLLAIIMLIETADDLPRCNCPPCRENNELLAKLLACWPMTVN